MEGGTATGWSASDEILQSQGCPILMAFLHIWTRFMILASAETTPWSLSWQCFLSEQTMPLVIKPQEMKMNRIGGKEWDLLAVVSRDLGQSHQRGAEAVITT